MKNFLVLLLLIIVTCSSRPNISVIKEEYVRVGKKQYTDICKYATAYLELKQLEKDDKLDVRTKHLYHEGKGIYVVPLKIEWINENKQSIKTIVINVKFHISELGKGT